MPHCALRRTFRWVMLVGILLISFLAQRTPPVHAAAFTVNTNADTNDANPGNGVCADGGGACSLRAAIEEANALAGTDTITVPAGTYTLTLGSELLITTDVTLIGAGAGSTIIEANANPGVATYRVLHNNGGTVTIASASIRRWATSPQLSSNVSFSTT